MRTLCAFLLFIQTVSSIGQPQVQLQLAAENLGYILDIAHADDDRLFILTRSGVIRIIENGVVLPDPYLDISAQVVTTGEMGALGLAFDPEFQTNGRFYIHYNAQSGGWWSRISRFTAADPADYSVDASTEQILFEVSQPGTFHNGGDVDFGADGMLYMTLGDSFNSATAQDLTHPLGSIHRLDVSDGTNTYSIPADNPYATSTGDTLKTIWAKGLRNPFRFGFDALTGDVWIGDVGSLVWEEVNFWPAGDHSGPNFGWRCFEGYAPASSPTPGCGTADQYDMPVAIHATSGSWCSVIGGRVYRGANYPPLYGRYIYSDYCTGELRSLLPDGNGDWIEEQLLPSVGTSVTCIGEDSALDIYIGRSNGTLYKITTPITTSIEGVNTDAVTIHPNPASDRIIISNANPEEIEFIDHTGREVYVPMTRTSTAVQINVGTVISGTYFVKITSDRSTRMIPVIVQH
jgi:glucose/arabinose dehydrogenase